jgi:hypothetical protein
MRVNEPPARVPAARRLFLAWRLARLEKRLELGIATRNATPQALCTELPGRYRTPRQLARNAKKLGKTRFFCGEDRNRTYACFPCVFEEFERYQFPSTLPLKTTRNRFPFASVYSVCSVVPTFPASVCSVCSVVPTFPASVSRTRS